MRTVSVCMVPNTFGLSSSLYEQIENCPHHLDEQESCWADTMFKYDLSVSMFCKPSVMMLGWQNLWEVVSALRRGDTVLQNRFLLLRISSSKAHWPTMSPLSCLVFHHACSSSSSSATVMVSTMRTSLKPSKCRYHAFMRNLNYTTPPLFFFKLLSSKYCYGESQSHVFSFNYCA